MSYLWCDNDCLPYLQRSCSTPAFFSKVWASSVPILCTTAGKVLQPAQRHAHSAGSLLPLQHTGQTSKEQVELRNQLFLKSLGVFPWGKMYCISLVNWCRRQTRHTDRITATLMVISRKKIEYFDLLYN